MHGHLLERGDVDQRRDDDGAFEFRRIDARRELGERDDRRVLGAVTPRHEGDDRPVARAVHDDDRNARRGVGGGRNLECAKRDRAALRDGGADREGVGGHGRRGDEKDADDQVLHRLMVAHDP